MKKLKQNIGVEYRPVNILHIVQAAQMHICIEGVHIDCHSSSVMVLFSSGKLVHLWKYS